MNLRYINRNGKLILQQQSGNALLTYPPQDMWMDVPIIEEKIEAVNPIIEEKIEAVNPIEFWLYYDDYFGWIVSITKPMNYHHHVVEIKKGYKLVSKKDILSAVSESLYDGGHIPYGVLKKLGFTND